MLCVIERGACFLLSAMLPSWDCICFVGYVIYLALICSCIDNFCLQQGWFYGKVFPNWWWVLNCNCNVTLLFLSSFCFFNFKPFAITNSFWLPVGISSSTCTCTVRLSGYSVYCSVFTICRRGLHRAFCSFLLCFQNPQNILAGLILSLMMLCVFFTLPFCKIVIWSPLLYPGVISIQ